MSIQMAALDTTSHVTQIIADKLFDPTERKIVPNRVITVDDELGLITDVWKYESDEEVEKLLRSGKKVVDLRGLTVLPGFVDVHVHRMLFFSRHVTLLTWFSIFASLRGGNMD